MAKITTLKEQRIPDHQYVAEGSYDNPEVLDFEHIRWKHLYNPFGPSDAIEIRGGKNDSELIGRAFLHRRDFITADGEAIAGATVTDLVVRPEHRSANLLIDLVKSIKSFSNSKFVIHSSNEVSDIFYRKMFKFPVYFSLLSSGFPVRISSLLQSRNISPIFAKLADISFAPARWIMRFLKIIFGTVTGMRLGSLPSAETLTAIHIAHHERTGPQFKRDVEFVKWRYLSGPISASKLYGIHHKSLGCLGYIAVRNAKVGDISFLILMDIVTRKALTKAEHAYLKLALLGLTMNSDADIAFVMFNSNHPELAPLGRLPFVRIPDRMLPHPTPIFSHRHHSVDEIHDLDRIYFTLADLDYF